MLSAANAQQKEEEEDQTQDENTQCRDCQPEASPIKIVNRLLHN